MGGIGGGFWNVIGMGSFGSGLVRAFYFDDISVISFEAVIHFY